ncbi:MAG: hypothetical protein AB2661_16030, partial [Candidatus Thiodiazotropha sp.]
MATTGQTGTIASISSSPVVSMASTAEEPKVIGEIAAEVEGPHPHLHQPIAPSTREANNSRILEAEPVVTQATSAAETPSTALQDADASLWDEATGVPMSNPDEKGDRLLPSAAQTDDAEEGEIVEDIMLQLMSADDPEALSDAESSSGAEGSKRKATDRERLEEGSMEYHRMSSDERKAETEPEVKRRRIDAGEPVFEVSMVAINGLTSVLQRLTGTMTTIEKRQGSTEKALIDVACALGKCQSALTNLKDVMEETAREERRREERWL